MLDAEVMAKGISLSLGFANNFKTVFAAGYFRTRIMGLFQCALPNHVIMCPLVLLLRAQGRSLPHSSCLLKTARVGGSGGQE